METQWQSPTEPSSRSLSRKWLPYAIICYHVPCRLNLPLRRSSNLGIDRVKKVGVHGRCP
jgi:hypothetical protein